MPIIIIGGGGHASVLVDILLKQNRDIYGIISPQSLLQREVFKGIKVFKDNSDIKQFDFKTIRLVNGVGMIPGSDLRFKLFTYFSKLGYKFESVICESAFVSKYSVIGTGAQILSNSVIQTGSKIGTQTIINNGAIVEHDCKISKHCHLAPNAVLCGDVDIGSFSFIGAGATVIQNCKIPNRSVIGAGACITKSPKKSTMWIAPPSLSKSKQ